MLIDHSEICDICRELITKERASIEQLFNPLRKTFHYNRIDGMQDLTLEILKRLDEKFTKQMQEKEEKDPIPTYKGKRGD